MAQVQLYIFHTGRVRVDRAIPLHERNPLAVTGLFRGKDKQLVLPVSAYLIVHPKGNVLIDTGWDTIYATQRPRQLFGMVDRISAPIIAADEGIDSKLHNLGLVPSDLNHVYISHMDFDHTSGLRLVREAKDIRTAEEEWAACNRRSLRYVGPVDKVLPFVRTHPQKHEKRRPLASSRGLYHPLQVQSGRRKETVVLRCLLSSSNDSR